MSTLNIEHILHKKSSVSGKTPNPSQIEYGEIAINFCQGNEMLSIKNSNDEVVTFVTKNQTETYISNELDSLRNTINGDISTAIDELEEKVGSPSTDDAEATGIYAELKEITESISALTEDLANETSARTSSDNEIKTIIGSDFTTANTVASAISAVTASTSALTDNLYVVSGKVDTLIGTDAGKSVRDIANLELAAALIPSGATESMNSLQEIAAWIQQHPEDASAMNLNITNIETAVGLNENGEHVASNGNYTSSATTIVGEISALDNQIKINADNITTLMGDTSVTNSIDSKIAIALSNIDMSTKQDVLTVGDGIAISDTNVISTSFNISNYVLNSTMESKFEEFLGTQGTEDVEPTGLYDIFALKVDVEEMDEVIAASLTELNETKLEIVEADAKYAVINHEHTELMNRISELETLVATLQTRLEALEME